LFFIADCGGEGRKKKRYSLKKKQRGEGGVRHEKGTFMSWF